jgi:hypothetical protein
MVASSRAATRIGRRRRLAAVIRPPHDNYVVKEHFNSVLDMGRCFRSTFFCSDLSPDGMRRQFGGPPSRLEALDHRVEKESRERFFVLVAALDRSG